MDQSFASSPLLARCFRLRLYRSIRNSSDPDWAAFIDEVSTGEISAVPGHVNNNETIGRRIIRLPMVTNLFNTSSNPSAMQQACSWTFGDDCNDLHNPVTNQYNTIVCLKHKRRRIYNEYVSKRRAAQTKARSKHYYATHKLEIPEGDEIPLDEDCPYNNEMLQELHSDNNGGVPDGDLFFHEGDVALLAVSLDRAAGLAKNMRVIIRNLGQYRIQVQLKNGYLASIPRVIFKFCPGGMYRQYRVVRRQFPLIPAYAITAHKAQSQNINKALLDARDPCFAHGQCNVILSRVPSRDHFAAVVDKNCVDSDGTLLMTNIVYKELLIKMLPSTSPAPDGAASP